MKDEQKYFSEVGLLQATKGVALLKPAELDLIADSPSHLKEIEESHIYFVCQRPRVRIVKAGSRQGNGITLTLKISTKDGEVNRDFLIPAASLQSEITNAEVEQNGTYFVFTDGSRDLTPLMSPEYLLKVADTGQLPELEKLEVVYIGQAFGDDGTRNAIDRLKSRSTLQQVLADHAHSAWWMEPVLLLFMFDHPQLITKMDGQGSPEITGDEDLAHHQSIRDEPLSDAQAVTIAEASLIRYFQPHYNSHFKGNYPTSDLQHLRDAYRLDYNAIITEIDTEDLYFSTFSKHQAAAEHHMATFDLHDRKERYSFFEMKPSPRKRKSSGEPR
jgi:hypothetical protein